MLKRFFRILSIVSVAIFFASTALSAASIYNADDYKLVKEWYKEIVGKELQGKEYDDAVKQLDSGEADLEELRRSFVNSKEARERLSLVDRMFWGFLARPPLDKEKAAIEETLLNIKDNETKQIENIINQREQMAVSGLSGKDLVADLKKCRHLDDMRKCLIWSDEYTELRIKDHYRRFLKREADNGGMNNYKNGFRNRNKQQTASEFWNWMRQDMINSNEAKKAYPDKVDRAFIMYLRRLPDKEESRTYAKKSDKDIAHELEIREEAIRPRIKELYRWIFGFEADAGGLKHWTGEAVKSYKMLHVADNMPGKIKFEAMRQVNQCPIVQRGQKFAEKPGDGLIGAAIAQITMIENFRGAKEIEEAEKNLPGEIAQDSDDEAQFRNDFEEYVLREPTDKELQKLLEELKKQSKGSDKSAGAQPAKGIVPPPKVSVSKHKSIVLSSAEFKAAAPARVNAFKELYKSIFYQEPEKRELDLRTQQLNSGAISIKGLSDEYLNAANFKAEIEKVQQALAKGELLPFDSLPLSTDQLKFVENMQNQLKALDFDFISLYRNFLMRVPTDAEMDAFAVMINKAVAPLNLGLLPPGELTPKSLDAFRKAQNDKLKNLPKIAKDTLEALKKQLLASPEFKDLAVQREIYLTQIYQQVLGREPDAGGLKFYLEKIAKGDITLDGIKAEMMKSAEFKKYQAALQAYKRLPPLTSEPSKNTSSEDKADIKSLKDIKAFEKFEYADKFYIKDCQKKEQGNYVEYTGKASFFGLAEKDFFAVNTKDVYGVQTWIAGLIFEGSWTPEQYFSGISNATVLELLKILKLNGGALIISMSDATISTDQIPENFKKFLDPVYKTTRTDDFSLSLTLGINLLGRLSLNHDPFKKVMDLVRCKQQELLIHGILTKNPEKIALKAYFQRFNTPDWLSKYVSTIQPMFEFTGKPAIGLAISLMTQIEKDNTPLEFTGKIEVPCKTCEDYTLIGVMSGTWENAFGIKGFSVSNLIAKYTPNKMSYALKGTAQIGTRVLTLVGQPPVVPGQFGIRGSLNELNLDDIIILTKKTGIDVRHENLPLPQIGLRDMDIMVSGVDDDMLGLYKGFLFDGRLLLNNEDIAKIHIRKFALGIEAQGEAKPLDVGPLKINGGDPGKGPMIDMALKATAAHCKIAGKADLFGTSRELQVFLTKNKILFELIDKLYNTFTTKIKVEGAVDLKKPAFGVEALMQSDFINKMVELVDKATKGKVPEVVSNFASKAFEVTEAGFKGNLDDCLDGNVPSFWIKFKCLGKTYSFSSAFNLKDANKAAEDLAGETGKKIIEKLEEFAKKIEEKVKEAVKKAVDTVKGWFKKKKEESTPVRVYDVRGFCYAIFF